MIDLQLSPVIYRQLSGQFPKIKRGRDCFLWDDAGRQLTDLSGGPCVTSLGHSNPEVISEVVKQMVSVPYVYSGFWGTDVAETLGGKIRDYFESQWPGWFGKVAFACAGNEAVDFACRLATQYWLEQGLVKTVFGARSYSFHGVGLLTSGLTDDYGRYNLMKPYYNAVRSGYVLRLPGYVDPRGSISRLEHDRRLIKGTVDAINSWSEPIAAIVIEPVGGPPVGALPNSDYYLRELRKLCDDQGILLIFDEVLCGVGRCGAFTYAQRAGVKPDIIVLGKALTSGYLPLSAICLSSKVIGCLTKGSGLAMVGTTYFNHAAACAAALGTLRVMQREHLILRVRRMESIIQNTVTHACEELRSVRGFRGKGCFWGFDFYDPSTGENFNSDLQFHRLVREEAYNAFGIVTYSKGQTVEGSGDYLVIAPPYTMPFDVLEHALKNLCIAIRNVETRLNV